MKFQCKFYNNNDHNKCPFSEKDDLKCKLRKSDFHQILPSYVITEVAKKLLSHIQKRNMEMRDLNVITAVMKLNTKIT